MWTEGTRIQYFTNRRKDIFCCSEWTVAARERVVHHLQLTDCTGPPSSHFLPLQWIIAHKTLVGPKPALTISLRWYHLITALPYRLKGGAGDSCWSVKFIQRKGAVCCSTSDFHWKKKNPIFLGYTYLLVFLPRFPPMQSTFSLFFLLVFDTDKINIALLLASFSYKSGFYFPAWREKLMLVKLRHQYTGNLDGFRVCFVFLWYRKTGKQRAQLVIKALC